MNRIYALSIVAVVAVAVAFLAGRNSDAQVRTQLEQSENNAVQWEYAQLIVEGDDQYRWLQGELNLTPDPVPLDTLAQRLRQRGGRRTFENLLNQIGSNGWELIIIDGSTRYTFKRRL
ncbi:MAG: hypothetical protein AAF456_24120 [Planctomycetota bacterium]